MENVLLFCCRHVSILCLLVMTCIVVVWQDRSRILILTGSGSAYIDVGTMIMLLVNVHKLKAWFAIQHKIKNRAIPYATHVTD